MSFPLRKVRTARSSRGTLKPSVTDFSEQVLGRYTRYKGLKGSKSMSDSVDDDHLCVRQVAKAQAGESSRPQGSQVGDVREYHIPAVFTSPREAMYTPEEVHRRHVIKSARLRSKLSASRSMKRLDSRPTGISNGPQEVNPLFLSQGKGEVISPRLFEPSRSDFLGHRSPRARPATTGRYFDSSNGLCISSTARLSLSTNSSRPSSSHPGYGPPPYSSRPDSSRRHVRPSSALSGKAWLNQGLRIQQMRLNIKDQQLITGMEGQF